MTASDNLDDLIAAASMLLAVLAILFSVWHAPINEALKLKTKGDPENLGGERATLRSAFFSKALPLAVGGVASVLVFLPEVCRFYTEARACSPTACAYDAVRAAFLLTQAFAFGLTVYCAYLAVALALHLARAYTGKK